MYYTVKSIAILIAVAAAGYSSYHIVQVGLTYELGAFAFVMPLFIDGLAIIATLARGNDRFPVVAQRGAVKVLAGAGAVSIAANLAAGHNIGQRLAGVVAVGAYVVAEWFVSKMSHKVAEATMTVADVDVAIAAAVAAAVAQLRATLAAETAALVAEAERITREAVAAELAAARAEAERLAATVAAPAPVATVANMATARVANGQAAERVVAILATAPDMATDEVAALAGASTRTVRRVRQQLATAAA